MSALDILEAAAGHMKDRAATYDKPAGERSMGATVAAFKAITGISMTEEQGWLFMGVLKQVRTQQGGWRADNYEDGAAYFALQGEAAARDRGRAAGDDFDERRIDTIGQNGNDGLHYSEDMTDPRNWQAWDWVECVEGSADVFTSGRLYRLRDKCQLGLAKVEADDEGFPNGMDSQRFRFHARPDADGWIKWEGGECPVGVDIDVDIRTAEGEGESYKAGDFVWEHDNAPYDIIAYRPNLATKQDKG